MSMQRSSEIKLSHHTSRRLSTVEGCSYDPDQHVHITQRQIRFVRVR